MLLERLGKELLFLDGGMGTLLQAEGLAPGELPETWNLKKRDKIIDIHRAYFEAGSDIVLANTFGANALKFHDAYTLEDVIAAAIQNVREAARSSVTDERTYYVALDVGPTGKLLKPSGELSFEDAYEAFTKTMRIGAKEGADLIHIETMSDTYEVKAAVLAAKEETNLPSGGASGGCPWNQLWNGTEADDSDSERDSKLYVPSDYCKAECRTPKTDGGRDVL